MNPQTVLRRAARIEYAVLRPPLGWLDERVVARLFDEDSAARQSFGSLLDAVDDVAQRWLHEPQATRPTDEPPADEPAAEEPVAEVELQPEPEPEPEPEPSTGEEVDELTAELLEEEETETFVGELAEQDDLRRVQAELDAKRLLAEQHEHDAQRGHPDGTQS